MNKKFLLMLCLFSGIMSCTKETPIPPHPGTAPVSFTLEGRGAAGVKSSSESPAEQLIDNYQIFVFNEDGRLDVSGYMPGAKALTLDCSVGRKKSVFALANHRENITGKIARKSDLDAIVSYLYDNDFTSGMVMAGSVDVDLMGAGKPVSVPVDRIVAKVKIDRIDNHLNPSLGSMTINGIYCINVCGDAPLIPDAEYQCRSWYNQRRYVRESAHTAVNSLISETGIDALVRNGEAHTVAHCFYVYPNSCIVDSSLDTFSPRFTRLVIEVTVGGGQRYYAIDLVAKSDSGEVIPLERNKLYHITSLDIRRLGSLDPDQPVVLDSFQYSISVNGWGKGFDKDVEI